MNILHNEFPELDKTYGGFKYFFIIYVVCIECIRILTFKFVFINFFSVCVKLCYVLVVRGWNRVIVRGTGTKQNLVGTAAGFSVCFVGPNPGRIAPTKSSSVKCSLQTRAFLSAIGGFSNRSLLSHYIVTRGFHVLNSHNSSSSPASATEGC